MAEGDHEKIEMRDEILRLKNRDPFVPFDIVLTSGDRFKVENPDLLAMGETVLHLMKPRSNAYDVLRLNQIASIQVLETV